MNIPIAKTVFEQADFDAILKPLRSGWVVQGPCVKEFETKWSAFTGATHSIATSNCTTALHLSLSALGVGPGDEVIVPAFTWVASANAVESLGATPVFCDIDLKTFNIDPVLIEQALSPRTKALMPVHLFGLSVDMDAVLRIAQKRNLLVVEDAACGFASSYKNKHVGTLGATGCFSFHPRKAITTGEGGMITTEDGALAAKLRAMRDHGASVSDHQRHLGPKPYLLPEFPYLGYNYRMTDIQGSIGSTQMDRATTIHQARAGWAERYNEALGTVSWLRTPVSGADYHHGYQAYVCLFVPEEINAGNVSTMNARRNDFMDHLQQNGVSTRPGTHAVHMLGYYAQKYHLKREMFLNSWVADQCSIALPLFPTMTEEEFSHVITLIKRYTV